MSHSGRVENPTSRTAGESNVAAKSTCAVYLVFISRFSNATPRERRDAVSVRVSTTVLPCVSRTCSVRPSGFSRFTHTVAPVWRTPAPGTPMVAPGWRAGTEGALSRSVPVTADTRYQRSLSPPVTPRCDHSNDHAVPPSPVSAVSSLQPDSLSQPATQVSTRKPRIGASP